MFQILSINKYKPSDYSYSEPMALIKAKFELERLEKQSSKYVYLIQPVN